MDDSKSSFEEAFRVWLREKKADTPVAMPSEEELLLYRDRNLSSERREEIRRMLVHDPALAATYLELVPQVSNEEKDQVWQNVLVAAEAEEKESPLPRLHSRIPRPVADTRPSRPTLWSGWLAAGWLVTAIGLGSWIYVLETRDEEGTATLVSLSVLAPGPQVGELLPEDLISRSDAEIPILSLSSDEEHVLLFLASSSLRYAVYRAELRASDGQIVGQITGLTRRGTGQIVVSLAPRNLLAGGYELAVYGEDPEESSEASSGTQLLGVYPFQLERVKNE